MCRLQEKEDAAKFSSGGENGWSSFVQKITPLARACKELRWVSIVAVIPLRFLPAHGVSYSRGKTGEPAHLLMRLVPRRVSSSIGQSLVTSREKASLRAR